MARAGAKLAVSQAEPTHEDAMTDAAVETKTCPNCQKVYSRVNERGRRIGGGDWTNRTACSRKCAWAVRKANGWTYEVFKARKFEGERVQQMLEAYAALPRTPAGKCVKGSRQALEAEYGCSAGYLAVLARRAKRA